jgi:hypothetical protein
MRCAVEQKLESAELAIREEMLELARVCVEEAKAARTHGEAKVKHALMWKKEAEISRDIAESDVHAALDAVRETRLACEAETQADLRARRACA